MYMKHEDGVFSKITLYFDSVVHCKLNVPYVIMIMLNHVQVAVQTAYKFVSLFVYKKL